MIDAPWDKDKMESDELLGRLHRWSAWEFNERLRNADPPVDLESRMNRVFTLAMKAILARADGYDQTDSIERQLADEARACAEILRTR